MRGPLCSPWLVRWQGFPKPYFLSMETSTESLRGHLALRTFSGPQEKPHMMQTLRVPQTFPAGWKSPGPPILSPGCVHHPLSCKEDVLMAPRGMGGGTGEGPGYVACGSQAYVSSGRAGPRPRDAVATFRGATEDLLGVGVTGSEIPGGDPAVSPKLSRASFSPPSPDR